MAAKFNRVRATAIRAVKDGVLPGLVVVAGGPGTTLLHEAFGFRQTDPTTEPATLDTVYDLASLTKALVTSLLVMGGVERGTIRLDATMAPLLPELTGPDKDLITVRQALAHAGGFVAHRPFHDAVRGQSLAPSAAAARVVALAAAEPLAYQPGSRSLYSDLGFILLGALVERAFAEPLDRLAQRLLFDPLGLAATFFLPGGPAAHTHGHPIAPTERCPVRGRLVQGEVHDLNAWSMGGVAGHAGLFGRAADVARMASALCALWHGADDTRLPFSPEVLRHFWSPSGVPGSTWRLGWDGPAPARSMAGERLDRSAVGHLGFTGCSLWIDPARATFVAVLANRVHPTVRDDPRFRALRPALNDAALDDLAA
jgi:serine-type D-Ala-D-Ala carboxypeptidase